MTDIIIYTDGSCLGNPGPGGYCAILRAIKDNHIVKEKVIKGAEIKTTNNRMELKAIIEALKSIKKPKQKITIYTDSKYAVDGVNKWLQNWLKKDFKHVKNDDLWRELYNLLSNHETKLIWVKSHQNNISEIHDINNMCDKIAREEATNLMHTLQRQ